MRVQFSQAAFQQYLAWQSENPKIVDRINELLIATSRTLFSGIGKPEPLRGRYHGLWSRRITQEHRLIYRVVGQGNAQTLEIAACRYHYE